MVAHTAISPYPLLAVDPADARQRGLFLGGATAFANYLDAQDGEDDPDLLADVIAHWLRPGDAAYRLTVEAWHAAQTSPGPIRHIFAFRDGSPDDVASHDGRNHGTASVWASQGVERSGSERSAACKPPSGGSP